MTDPTNDPPSSRVLTLTNKLNKQDQLLNFALAREKSAECQMERMRTELDRVIHERTVAFADLRQMRSEFETSIQAIELSMMSRFTGYESQITSLRADKSEVESINRTLQYVRFVPVRQVTNRNELSGISGRLSEIARLEELKREELKVALAQAHNHEFAESLRIISTKDAELEQAAHNVHSLHEQLGALRDTVTDLERRFQEKQSLLQIKEGVIEDLSSQVQALTRRLEPDETIVVLRNDLANALNELKIKDETVLRLQYDLREKEDTVTFISQEVEAIKTSYDVKLQEVKAEMEEAHSNTQDQLRAQLKEAAQALIEIETQFRKAQDNNKTLQQQLQVADTENRANRKKISAVIHAIQDSN